MHTDQPRRLKRAHCVHCWKKQCICGFTSALRSNYPIVILQHPQEVSKQPGTARLLSLSLENGVHRIGLSWPSLRNALGDSPWSAERNWAVLYLGSLKDSDGISRRGFSLLSGPGRPMDPTSLHGFVLLDGNWQQAKVLWYRNPWLRRLPRLILPDGPNSYSVLRKAARTAALSTFGAASQALELVGESPTVLEHLSAAFTRFIEGSENRED